MTDALVSVNFAEHIEIFSALYPVSLYGLLKKYGKYYTPMPLSNKYTRGKARECYKNACKLAEAENLQYVEGLAVPDFLDIPIEHAWCVDANNNVVDNTWPITGVLYYGVPFDRDFINSMLVDTGYYGIIKFESEVFRAWFKMRMEE